MSAQDYNQISDIDKLIAIYVLKRMAIEPDYHLTDHKSELELIKLSSDRFNSTKAGEMRWAIEDIDDASDIARDLDISSVLRAKSGTPWSVLVRNNDHSLLELNTYQLKDRFRQVYPRLSDEDQDVVQRIIKIDPTDEGLRKALTYGQHGVRHVVTYV